MSPFSGPRGSKSLSGTFRSGPLTYPTFFPEASREPRFGPPPGCRPGLAHSRAVWVRRGPAHPGPAYGNARHNGLTLTPALRRHYFRTRMLSPTAPAVLRIRFIDGMKSIKRWLRRLVS